MRGSWLAAVLLLAAPALAMETQVLPRGVWVVDLGYLKTTVDKQWSGDRRALALIDPIPRYEPGAGLQGLLTAKPKAEFDVALLQVLHGVTDRLSVSVTLPIVLRTRITTNVSWQPGDYQSSIGRVFSLDDFWAWAGSMRQPKVSDSWEGNRFTLSDIVLGGRYLLPEAEWMRRHHLRWAAALQLALPTGTNADPEEVVSAGTNLWELHAAGDAELHLSADKQFFVDDDGVHRLNVGADVFFAWLRPREYTAGTGTKNPLLNNIAPYVGGTYVIDPGDWLGATVSLDVAPVLGPTRASIVSGGSLERARALPPLLTLSASYTYIATGQSDWRSRSPLWDWDREKAWQPGEKNAVRVMATVSLLRLGVPVQLYGSYRTQDLVPGRYTRPATVVSAGVRTVLKFW